MNEDNQDQKQSEGSQGQIQQQQQPHSQQSTPPSMIEHNQHLIHGGQMHQQRDEASLMQEYAHQQYEASKLTHHPQQDHSHQQQHPDNLMLPKVDPDHGMYSPYDQMGPGPSGGQHMYQLQHHMGMGDMGDSGELSVMRGGFGRPRLHSLKQTGMSRPRGRPKGSKNKRPRKQKDTARIERPPKRPRGRPRKWPPEMYEGFNRSQDAHIRQLQQQNMITGMPMGMGMQGPSSSGSDEMMISMSSSQSGIISPMLPCCQPSTVMGGRLPQHIDTTCDIFPPTGMPHSIQHHHPLAHPGAPGQQPTEFLRQYMPHIDVDSNVAMMMQMQHGGQHGGVHQNEQIQHRTPTSMHPSPSPSSMSMMIEQAPPPSSSTGPQQHNVAVTEHEQHLLWLQQQQQAELQQHHLQQTPHTTS